MELSTAGPLKDGSIEWWAYVRKDRRTHDGPFKGGKGATPQEAVDNAFALLKEWEDRPIEAKPNLPPMNLNLSPALLAKLGVKK